MREEGEKKLGCVVTQRKLILHKAEWKRNRKRVVFAQGAFDLLHPGHIRLLEKARSLGEILVVGVRSDAAVRALHERKDRPADAPSFHPLTSAAERAEIVAALAAVDYAVICDSTDPAEILAQLQPDFIVEGTADRSAVPFPKHSAGGSPSAVFIPLEPGFSTARLIERIQKLRA
jgi:rfaE bifunctional protein nucleotidyltransferase chain/domain